MLKASKIVKQTTQIIIVNYNAGKWLSRSVASALAHSQGEVTVVDNASTDRSVEIAQQALGQHPRLHWIINKTNRGFAAANNQVLADLRSEFAVLMNPDCEINEQTLPRILQVFQDEPILGLASCRILNEDGSLQATCRRRFPTPWSAWVRLFQLHRLFPNNAHFVNFDYGESAQGDNSVEFIEAISGAFMVVRKAAFNQVGLLDEAYFMHCEDLDWCKRFELGGWKVGFVGAAHAVHAKGVSSASRPIRVLWTLHRGMNRFFDKFYREQSFWLLRLFVKLGIAVSFIVRSVLTLIRRLFSLERSA